ncbi:hypothetical protein IAR55_005990 [Kwoniella newhampshirensis]|uniref:Protein kinase domain-containing protein n=1 Tax=Kwoniella newhampshirensis TaxID=1651941 RepID=A0AAW0YUE0_9TREE
MGIDFQHIFSTHPTQKGDSGPHAAHRKKEFAFDNTTLGAGGYSKVIKAKWKARGSMVVAVKVVRKEAVKDREAYLRIIDIGFPRINEHPNICAGLDWFETPSKFYVTFPILTGGELLERLNTRGRFTEEATKRVMKVILDILAFIHSHGIIHRDIKPDNFLYRTPNSEVEDILLIDFGISKVLPGQNDDDPKNQYEAGGTPGYAAPEVFCGTGYGKNSDLFGAGVICYNLLSSWSPWESQDTLALIQETAHSNINFPEGPFEGVSEQAKLFIRNLLQPPNRRPSAKIAGKHPWLTVTKDDSEVDDHILNAQQADESNVEPIQPHPTVRPSHPLAKQITALSAVNNA